MGRSLGDWQHTLAFEGVSNHSKFFFHIAFNNFIKLALAPWALSASDPDHSTPMQSSIALSASLHPLVNLLSQPWGSQFAPVHAPEKSLLRGQAGEKKPKWGRRSSSPHNDIATLDQKHPYGWECGSVGKVTPSINKESSGFQPQHHTNQ